MSRRDLRTRSSGVSAPERRGGKPPSGGPTFKCASGFAWSLESLRSSGVTCLRARSSRNVQACQVVDEIGVLVIVIVRLDV
jgi:hypothetical protein